MLFNSYGFIFLYLPTVFAGFFLIAPQSHRLAALWLAASSVFFYGWWDTKFVLLLLASIVVNYSFGYLIGHARASGRSRKLLIVAITANLMMLVYFKYTNFFINIANSSGAQFGLLEIVLPLGISFFTFTQIAFLVDVHRGIAREYNFIHYLLFVTWFPHLIAGPVIHHKQMMPQFAMADTYRYNSESIAVGLTLFSLGLFKKVVIADQLAIPADTVFDYAAGGGQPMFFSAWVGSLSYALQLYFDFSGYSDMAIGLSRLFNVKLPINFNSPYKASSIVDFWKRWHMTLSAFLRDYLYIPLGGNRKGTGRRLGNLMVTMLLGGLWHGAGWNFMLWGALHGCYLMINLGWRRLVRSAHVGTGALGHSMGILVTFTAVLVAWVPFRSTDLETTWRMFRGMAGMNGISVSSKMASMSSSLAQSGVIFDGFFPMTLVAITDVAITLPLGLLIVWMLPNTQQWLSRFTPAWDHVAGGNSYWGWQPTRSHALLTGVLFGLCLLSLHRTSKFLYFQF